MHVPVLLNETLRYLEVGEDRKYIDATYGFGGHSKKITETGGRVLGIDRDPVVVSRAKRHKYIKVVQGDFSELEAVAEQYSFIQVDGVLFDLGFGSHQLDDHERGFSFQKDGPLDMRYNQKDNQIETAEQILNNYSEEDLYKIFKDYGEETRFGKKIARTVANSRRAEPLKTTRDLFELIKESLPVKFRHRAGNTARKIFQALRIAVNNELDNLEKALPQALHLLFPGGRLVVISFHSLEDRIVKNYFRQQAKDCICPPEVPVCRCDKQATLKVLTSSPVTAGEEEVKRNPRSKSAKLRAAEKI